MGKNKNKSKSNKKSKTEVIEEPEVEETLVLEEDNVEDSQGNEETQENTKKAKKVVSFSDEFTKLEKLRTAEVESRNEKDKLIKAHEEKLKELNSKLKKNRVEQKNIIEKLQSIHNKEVKLASKEKRKRSGKNTGGFNREELVPKKLVEYLGLEEGTMLPRPQVIHLMSEKFKKEGLKNGQVVELNAKNAKKLGKEAGYKIEFKDNQPFVAAFYNAEKSSSQTKSKKSSKSNVDV